MTRTEKMIEFFVPGHPAPGGSKRYVGHSKAGRDILIDAAGEKNRNWRASVEVIQVVEKHYSAYGIEGIGCYVKIQEV